MFHHNQSWDIILEMTYFDLEYLHSWHERMVNEEKKAMKELEEKGKVNA